MFVFSAAVLQLAYGVYILRKVMATSLKAAHMTGNAWRVQTMIQAWDIGGSWTSRNRLVEKIHCRFCSLAAYLKGLNADIRPDANETSKY